MGAHLTWKLAGWFVAMIFGMVSIRPADARDQSVQQRFSPEQLRQDLAFVKASIDATHPDPGHSMDVAAFERQMGRIAQDIDKPLDIDETWRLFATLNPIMADGHLLVGYGDWVADARSHLEKGGVFFPYEVTVDPAGRVFITATLGGGATPLAGRRILAINGMDADEVGSELLARMHGDTAAFRAALLSDRWWFFYWKMYGAPRQFDFTVEGDGPRHVSSAGSHSQPAYLANKTRFEKAFGFQRLPGKAALLTVNTFSWPDKQRFYAFTQQAFREIKDKGITTLIVDVRRNGGGDDDMWMQGILRYVADKPYRWASGYEKKVIPGHVDDGQTIGDVVHGQIDRLIQPEPGNPLHYTGKLYVLIGRQTYSSAILFSNVVQDFKFGTIAGEGGVVRAAQSGGIQTYALPNTGLAVTSPRFILTRPSGATKPAFVEPDVTLKHDVLRPSAEIEALLRLTKEAVGR